MTLTDRKSGIRDSNPAPTAYKTGALPTELIPIDEYIILYNISLFKHFFCAGFPVFNILPAGGKNKIMRFSRKRRTRTALLRPERNVLPLHYVLDISVYGPIKKTGLLLQSPPVICILSRIYIYAGPCYLPDIFRYSMVVETAVFLLLYLRSQ